MRSSFFEYNVAISGLFVAKAGLEVTAHNIANASDKRYSRQVVLQRATYPLALNTGKGMVGSGAEVYGIGQIRNTYLDTKYWKQSAVLGEYQVKSSELNQIQFAFNEPSDNSINAITNNFFNSLRSLQTTAGDAAYRTAVRESATTLAKNLNSTATALHEQQKSLNDAVKSTVSEINTIGTQIKNLNKQIKQYEMSGENANDLRDERAKLVDRLSTYVNVDVKEIELNPDVKAGKLDNPDDIARSQKRFVVQINGQEFINDTDIKTLECKERSLKNNPEDVDGLCDIYWSNGSKFPTNHPNLQGQLKAYLDLRDGNNGDSLSGKFSGYTTTDGRMEVTLTDFNRGDMQSSGNITINGTSYAYDSLTVDNEATPPQMKVTIPASSGYIDFGGQRIAYSNLSFDGTEVKMKLASQPTSGGFVRIGDMNFDGNITSNVNGDGTFEISISGGSTFNAIKNATGGESAKISIDTNYKGIPHYLKKLDDFARTMARTLNEGTDKNGNKIPGVTGHKDGYNGFGKQGVNFFSYRDTDNDNKIKSGDITDYNKITADNFTLSQEILDNIGNIATSITANNGVSDNNLLLQFTTLQENPNLFAEGKIGDYIQGIVSELGIDAKEADNFEKNYTSMVDVVDQQRTSVSGVDVNEETLNMLKYQQLYQAAAKLASIIDGIYDTTINKLGA